MCWFLSSMLQGEIIFIHAKNVHAGEDWLRLVIPKALRIRSSNDASPEREIS